MMHSNVSDLQTWIDVLDKEGKVSTGWGCAVEVVREGGAVRVCFFPSGSAFHTLSQNGPFIR